MFERTVMGVDPGTRALGLAIVQAGSQGRAHVAWSTTVSTAASLPTAERLRRLAGAVRDAIAEHRPEALAIERLIWNKNVGSAMEVARASGATVEEYAPLEVKMAVTGAGNASKEQVRRALTRVLGTTGVPSQPDAADAVAVAICHMQQSRLRRLTREAAAR
jgi:crossover junction endodeoxyribonuclease RuvC